MPQDTELPEFVPPRTFEDRFGVTWEVREIRSQAPSDKLAHLLGKLDRRRSGWLVFQSATGEKRRASPVPFAWRDASNDELSGWCESADRVPPAPARRQLDG